EASKESKGCGQDRGRRGTRQGTQETGRGAGEAQGGSAEKYSRVGPVARGTGCQGSEPRCPGDGEGRPEACRRPGPRGKPARSPGPGRRCSGEASGVRGGTGARATGQDRRPHQGPQGTARCRPGAIQGAAQEGPRQQKVAGRLVDDSER